MSKYKLGQQKSQKSATVFRGSARRLRMELRMMDGQQIEQMDVLNGYAEIAAALRINVRQAKHRVAIGAIPVFRQGRIVCARRSTIAAHFAAQEAAAGAAG